MNRLRLLQEVLQMRFEEAYGRWKKRRLTQAEAADVLGVSERTFRRYIARYEEEEDIRALLDRRISQPSGRRAPVDEIMSLMDMYQSRYKGWNVKHFYSYYKREGGRRGYTWVKNTLQANNLVAKAVGLGRHRKQRERSPLKGMMLHQDGSTHEWVPGKKWDLIVTMDDATNEHYSMFFVPEEGTASSFRGMKEVIERHGLCSSLYTDRGSHYWNTPEAGGKVDKGNLTQFGRAMRHLGITMIPAYSPEARGRSERMFKTHQDRLVKELALHGIREMEDANRFLKEVYLPTFNQEFMKPASVEGTAFVPCPCQDIDDVLCEQHHRVVSRDNCVSFNNLRLQIPANKYRLNYVKAEVCIHCYCDGRMSVFHGPRKLAVYAEDGSLLGGMKSDSLPLRACQRQALRAPSAALTCPSIQADL